MQPGPNSWKQNCPWSHVDYKRYLPTFLLLSYYVEHATVSKQCFLWSLAQFLNVFTCVLGYNTEERLCRGWNHVACYWWMWSVHSHSMLICFSFVTFNVHEQIIFPWLCDRSLYFNKILSSLIKACPWILKHKTTSSLKLHCSFSHFVSFLVIKN